MTKMPNSINAQHFSLAVNKAGGIYIEEDCAAKTRAPAFQAGLGLFRICRVITRPEAVLMKGVVCFLLHKPSKETKRPIKGLKTGQPPETRAKDKQMEVL